MEETTKTTLKKMLKKHKDFLDLFKKNACLVYFTCEKFGIEASTYYEWLKVIEGFREEVEAAKEKMVDMSEGQLYKKINEGETAAILFHLKCKGKHRGYIERQEVEHSANTEKPITFQVIGI